MHITKVELQNFKRFTDLTIDGIPADAKLVLLIGSNGSGKSSVFDAFEIMNVATREEGYSEYEVSESRVSLRKDKNIPDHVAISVAGHTQDLHPGSFYGRTSFRQLPRLTRTQLGSSLNFIEQDSDRPRSYIDRDERFENDIEQISQRILKEIFRSEVSSKQLKATYIQPINNALAKIFGPNETTKLSLIEIIPPLEGKVAQITFQKGQSEIHYNYLSAGEKEVINILFNLLVRRDQFTDTVYFFDELDLHLNTKLQFNLLKEITENWIPENCQLWTASHSLGFIDYARQYEKGVMIDFDDLDFDQPQTLFPQPKDQLDVYDIAVPKEMLFEIMKDKKVVACENQNAEFYNLLALPNTIFVGMKDARSVFLQVKNDPRYHSLRDRDFISDTEIERIESAYPNHHILRYYNFENYLYHPDNIAEVNPIGFNRDTYIEALTQYKRSRYDYILPELVSSRQTYEEFKTDDKLKDKSTDSIVDDFKIDDFERFYKFFNMKNQHEKIDPSLGKIPQKRLVQTAWFRQQIEAVLNR
ncbi:AAA family ATPase [Spirosoma sp. HMF3257]|uniref:Chromosome segregation protein SMC n=1 Tax=Spirosoma telluris TaxID=2183553 RepID=A0A327NK77_9BACT|nr:AAA family ATPase [Spirosoma telluris]RAI74789.1 chromosome segregation protein SMC [Spirosoma telluris]